MFKVGDRVVCIEDDKFINFTKYIIKYNTYIIKDIFDFDILSFDEDPIFNYKSDIFISLKEYRKQKLIKIIYNER